MSESKNPKLAQWCHTIKFQNNRKEKKLTKKRITRLTKLGFVLEHVYDLRWDEHFMQLKEYKKKHGHCNVPITNDNNDPTYTLARWVQRQRGNFHSKNNRLTVEREIALNNIGFCWTIRLKRWSTNKVSNDKLLRELKRLYLILGESPSQSYINEYGKYSAMTYYNHFGSMGKALKAASIDFHVHK